MELTVGYFLVLAVMAFVCEYIDSALGMGYGTILSPVLIIMGIPPAAAVPAVLLSQAVGGFTASVFHQRFENVTLRPGSRDLNIVLIITGFGIAATVFGACAAVALPAIALKIYIGLLVTVMGFILLANRTFVFSWKKMIGVGALSAFNKGISGGGFGPVVTAGQILAGQEHRGAIGVTTLAEAPICITAFLVHLIGRTMHAFDVPVMQVPVRTFLARMFSRDIFPWELLLALTIGSLLVAPFGAFTTRKLNPKVMRWLLGVLVTVLGLWTLVKAF